jgi:hypothetical protein
MSDLGTLGQIKLQRHETAEALLRTFWSFALEPGEDPATFEMGALDEHGNEVELSWETQLESLNRMGFWGYADYSQWTVHMWARPDVPEEVLMAFLGHEVGHFLNPHDTSSPDLPAEVAEEEKVDGYGEVAAQAFRLLKQSQGLPVFSPGESYVDTGRRGDVVSPFRALVAAYPHEVDGWLVTHTEPG